MLAATLAQVEMFSPGPVEKPLSFVGDQDLGMTAELEMGEWVGVNMNA